MPPFKKTKARTRGHSASVDTAKVPIPYRSRARSLKLTSHLYRLSLCVYIYLCPSNFKEHNKACAEESHTHTELNHALDARARAQQWPSRASILLTDVNHVFSGASSALSRALPAATTSAREHCSPVAGGGGGGEAAPPLRSFSPGL